MNTKDNTALNTYLDEIGQLSPLTLEEEKALAEQIAQGSQRALERLATSNLKFVVAMAHRLRGRGLAEEDLIAEGNIAIFEAASKYDGNRGSRFVAYAAPFVRKAMEQAIDQQTGLYRMPRAQRAKQQDRMKSIDAPLSEGNKYTLLDILVNSDAEQPEETLAAQVVAEALTEIVSTLPEREQTVVRAFYGLGRSRISLAEIAQELGVKRERARQIRDAALRKAARNTTNRALKAFIRHGMR